MQTGKIQRALVAIAVASATVVTMAPGPSAASPRRGERPAPARFATFNASLNRNTTGQLIADLSSPGNAQAATVAEIIQRVRPDVLLINEFD